MMSEKPVNKHHEAAKTLGVDKSAVWYSLKKRVHR